MPTIHSLIFELETDPPRSRELVVQLNESDQGESTRPAHPDHTLLDVRHGDTIILHGTPELVLGVKPWRTSLCRGTYPAAESGNAWLESHGRN